MWDERGVVTMFYSIENAASGIRFESEKIHKKIG